MKEANPDNIVLVSIGKFFEKAAKEAVIEQNGCLVVPKSNLENPMPKPKKEVL